jgi:transmembrane 9 superfamily protein 2/4
MWFNNLAQIGFEDCRNWIHYIPLLFSSRLVDNLPCATKNVNPETSEIQYEHGYRLGGVDGASVYINNHLKLVLLYHTHNE